MDSVTNSWIKDLVAGSPGAVIAGRQVTSLAGERAVVYGASVIENGSFRRILVTVTRKHIIGVFLHATPETFAERWGAYKKLSNSVTLKLD